MVLKTIINIIIALIMIFVYIVLVFMTFIVLDRFENRIVSILVGTIAEVVMTLLFIYLYKWFAPLKEAMLAEIVPTQSGNWAPTVILILLGPGVYTGARVDSYCRDRLQEKYKYIDAFEMKVVSGWVAGIIVATLTIVLAATTGVL